jgi:hypothetical protein
MPFIEEVLKHKSLSIVGLEKNTGKTECLNYVINRLKGTATKIALTSIGLDGESADALNKHKKPEIELSEGIVFATSEYHYRKKSIISEIIDVSLKKTALGRLVTARSLSKGQVILSGPSDTHWLRLFIDKMALEDIDITIVDGAISRFSLASPAVTECMILNTGAAVSSTLRTVIKKTKFACELINLTQYPNNNREKLEILKDGIWAIRNEDELHRLEISSAMMIDKYKEGFLNYGKKIFFTGMVTDKLLNHLKIQKEISEITIIVRDFTKLFITREVYDEYIMRGGKIFVLHAAKLIAVCVNPFSPEGYDLDSNELQDSLSAELNIPVYDIKNLRA